MIKYITGDIHDVIKTLDDDTIDCIYTDPPFNSTNAKWDKPLRWPELFSEMWRVLKPDGVIILYSAIPFTYELLIHERPKYHYTWIKNNSTGFFSCKYQPLRQTEEILIYYKKNGTYNPQMKGDKFVKKRNVKFGGKHAYWGEHGVDKDNEYIKEEGHRGKYPTNVLNYEIRKDKTGITRTDEHIDFFLKTYTGADDTVLDMTCHNTYVGDRCTELGRNYIGVDLEILREK